MNARTTFFERSYLAQMLGPFFLIPVFLLSGVYPSILNYDLLAIGAFGLLLAATKQIRGCAYALVLLGLSVAIKHLWISDHHLFQACLESSVAFSLIVTSLVFSETEGASIVLQEQMDKKGQTIGFLEEELSGQREKFTTELDAAGQKLLELQKCVEETQNELSALGVLNEVLRKTTANALESNAKTNSQYLSAESRVGMLLEEIDSLQRELSRLSNNNELTEQNKALFKELNAVRLQATQTHLINETLARMLAGQADKTALLEQLEVENKELEQKNGELQEQLVAQVTEASAEKRVLAERNGELQEQLNVLTQKADETLEKKIVLEEALLEKTEQVEALAAENQRLHEKAVNETNFAQENLSKRSAQTLEVEALYRQLRDQFAEKDAILHSTRKQLFLAETELQRLEKIAEERRVEEDPLPPALRREIEALEEEKAWMQEENSHLTALITELMAATPEKKK